MKVHKSVNQGIFACCMGKAQVLFGSITSGEAIANHQNEFTVLKINKQTLADDCDGVCKVDVERLPEVMGSII